MDNPTIQTDLVQILNKLDSKIDNLDRKFDEKFNKLEERLNKIEISQAAIIGSINTTEEKLSGQIKALDTKTEQLNIRVGNIEFAVRGVLVGLAIVILDAAAFEQEYSYSKRALALPCCFGCPTKVKQDGSRG